MVIELQIILAPNILEFHGSQIYIYINQELFGYPACLLIHQH